MRKLELKKEINMIAITGVTGKLGGRVARVLSERGIKTVHIARNPMKAKK